MCRSSRGTLEVRGCIRGAVTHEGRLIVAPGGVCSGPVRSDDIYLQGEIHGDVTVTGTLRIGNGGQLFGDADCRRLVIDPGGRFVGINRSDSAGRPHGPAAEPLPEASVQQGREAPGAQASAALPAAGSAATAAVGSQDAHAPAREPAPVAAAAPAAQPAQPPAREPAAEPGQGPAPENAIVFRGYMLSRRRPAGGAPERAE